MGPFILAVGILMFLINVVHTQRKAPRPTRSVGRPHARVDDDITAERADFDRLPTVHALDEFFHRKYEDVRVGDRHDLRRVATVEDILAEQEQKAAADGTCTCRPRPTGRWCCRSSPTA